MLATRPPLTGQLRELRPDPRRRMYGTVAIRSEIAGIGHGATYGSARSCSLASNYWYIKRDPPRKSPVAPVIQVSTRTVLRRPPVCYGLRTFTVQCCTVRCPALLLALAEAAAGGAVGFFGTRWAVLRRISSSPTRSSRNALRLYALPVHNLPTTSPPHRTNVTCCCVCSSCAQVGTRVAASVQAS